MTKHLAPSVRSQTELLILELEPFRYPETRRTVRLIGNLGASL